MKIMFMVIALAEAITGYVPHMKNDGAVEIAKAVEASTRNSEVDPVMVLAIIAVESGFRHDVFNKGGSGCVGLMQITPKYANEFHDDGVEYTAEDMLDIHLNVRLGVGFMKKWKLYHEKNCKGKHHWVQHYHGGKRVKNNKWYAKRVLKRYNSFKITMNKELSL